MPHRTIVTQKIWVCDSTWSQYKAQSLRRGRGWAVLGGSCPRFALCLLRLSPPGLPGERQCCREVQLTLFSSSPLPVKLN